MATYTDKELQAVPTSWKTYGKCLQVLARRAVLEVEGATPERKAKAAKEIAELSKDLYIPRKGDSFIWEQFSNGVRYRCTVKAIHPDGWVFDSGQGSTFHPKFGMIVK